MKKNISLIVLLLWSMGAHGMTAQEFFAARSLELWDREAAFFREAEAIEEHIRQSIACKKEEQHEPVAQPEVAPESEDDFTSSDESVSERSVSDEDEEDFRQGTVKSADKLTKELDVLLQTFAVTRKKSKSYVPSNNRDKDYRKIEELIEGGADHTPVLEFIEEYRKNESSKKSVHGGILNALESSVAKVLIKIKPEMFGDCGSTKCRLVHNILLVRSPSHSRGKGSESRGLAMDAITKNFAGCKNYKKHTIFNQPIIKILKKMCKGANKKLKHNRDRLREKLSKRQF